MAVVTELDGEYATIAELQLTGELGGSGAVELECLEKPQASAPWRAAYTVYKQRVLQEEIQLDEEECEAMRLADAVKAIAARNGVNPKLLHQMLEELKESGFDELPTNI